MKFLVARLEGLLERAEESQCHQMALKFMIEAGRKELAEPSSSASPQKSASPTKPSHKHSKSLGLAPPARTRNARRRSSTNLENEPEPEHALLRALGLSLPNTDDDLSLDPALSLALRDRRHKLLSHSAAMQSTIETSITAHVTDAHVTMKLLQGALLAGSAYGKVRLLDADTEEIMDMTEGEIRDAERRLRGVNLRELQGKNVTRDRLVERWGG